MEKILLQQKRERPEAYVSVEIDTCLCQDGIVPIAVRLDLVPWAICILEAGKNINKLMCYYPEGVRLTKWYQTFLTTQDIEQTYDILYNKPVYISEDKLYDYLQQFNIQFLVHEESEAVVEKFIPFCGRAVAQYYTPYQILGGKESKGLGEYNRRLALAKQSPNIVQLTAEQKERERKVKVRDNEYKLALYSLELKLTDLATTFGANIYMDARFRTLMNSFLPSNG